MAKVTYLGPIATVKGYLHDNKLVYKHNSIPNGNGETIDYTARQGKRTTPYSATEIARQNRFKTLAGMVKTKMNSTDIAALRASWRLVKSTYPSFRKYLWALSAQELDDQGN